MARELGRRRNPKVRNVQFPILCLPCYLRQQDGPGEDVPQCRHAVNCDFPSSHSRSPSDFTLILTSRSICVRVYPFRLAREGYAKAAVENSSSCLHTTPCSTRRYSPLSRTRISTGHCY